MRSTSAGEPDRRDRGSATAEFAIALPAVLLLLALSLGAVAISGAHVRAQDAAADAARSAARGDPTSTIAARLERQVPGASLHSWREGDLICARIEVPVTGPAALLGVRPAASSCALAGGR